MSLLRLLTSGRCLIGLKDSATCYRMRRQNLLPKFGSSNPFLVRGQTAKPAEPNPSVATSPSAQLASPDERVAAPPQNTKPLPALVSAGQATRTISGRWRMARVAAAKAGVAGRLVQKLRRWAANRNPFARRAAAKGGGTSCSQAASRSPVQGELCLENIRVVRNDLSEADVEIVPASRLPGKKGVRKPDIGGRAELTAAESC